MNVILLERVAKLGNLGEIVSVKEGYARNYLLPQGKALRSSEANIQKFEVEKAAREARNEETRVEAQAASEKIDGEKYVVIRSASDAGALYGSVTPRDAATAVSESGIPVDRKQIRLIQPIKELGLHEVTVRLHPEVEATVTLNVARTPEEADIQASGKTIREASTEDDELDIEIAELLDDVDAVKKEGLDGQAEQGEDEPSTDESESKATESEQSADKDDPGAAETKEA